MARRLFALLTAMSWLVACPAAAQPPGGEPGRKPVPRKTAHVSLAKQRGGGPVLVIDYPWKPYTKASIEVRLMKGKAADTDDRPPLLFQKTRMKGKDADVVYRCLDRAAEGDITKTFTAEGTDFEVVGRLNALQKPSVCVVCRPKPEGEEAPAQVAAALLPLESWAVNARSLYIDLPDAFADTGTLQVWFLRDDAVIWRETVTWPGIGPSPPADKQPPAETSKPAADG